MQELKKIERYCLVVEDDFKTWENWCESKTWERKGEVELKVDSAIDHSSNEDW